MYTPGNISRKLTVTTASWGTEYWSPSLDRRRRGSLWDVKTSRNTPFLSKGRVLLIIICFILD